MQNGYTFIDEATLSNALLILMELAEGCVPETDGMPIRMAAKHLAPLPFLIDALALHGTALLLATRARVVKNHARINERFERESHAPPERQALLAQMRALVDHKRRSSSLGLSAAPRVCASEHRSRMWVGGLRNLRQASVA